MSDVATKLPSVLVANRGEIACRVFRTARRLGVRTIAVYSEADAAAPHVRQADVAVPIGPAPARESYLVGEKIIAAAKETGAAAIHPGYGFLSENDGFAEACAKAGIVFVGPPPSAIRAMGLKDASKRIAEAAGVPVVPGYHGEEQNEALLAEEAARIGYPLLIKAVAGGGGKGMKRVDRAEDFSEALASARREAVAAFGNPNVLIEKYVLSPRHIEVQVFGDSHGNVVHLFERDCSLQRRHQKVIEEAPAPGMTVAMRKAMTEAAVALAKSVGYVSAGTVEFIADGSEGLRPDRFFFMEMNTRLQVEHPVTEAITGLDLVEWQLCVAAGQKLPKTQEELAIDGHAVEARLYAEDPERGFLPSTGKLWALRLPGGEGIRVDTGVEEGGAVTPFYDPMIAKVIAHAPTRAEALDRLAGALDETVVAGPRSNVSFLARLCRAAGFRKGAFDAGFIERGLVELGASPQPVDFVAAAVAAQEWLDRQQADLRHGQPHRRTAGTWRRDPWQDGGAFSLCGERVSNLVFACDGERLEAQFRDVSPAGVHGVVEVSFPQFGQRVHPATDWSERTHRPFIAGEPHTDVVWTDASLLVVRYGRQTEVRLVDPMDVDLDALDGHEGDAVVKSPMHGKVVAVHVSRGEAVTKGQRVAVVEAMKMEHVLTAPREGVVSEVGAVAGQQVAEGAKLVVIAEPNAAA